MQTLRPLKALFAAALVLAAACAERAAAREIDQAAIDACRVLPEMRARLGCYDDLFGAPLSLAAPAARQAAASAPPPAPGERVLFYRRLFEDLTPNEARLALSPEGAMAVSDSARSGDPGFAALVAGAPKEGDVAAAVRAETVEGAAKAAGMVVSCEGERTNLILVWDAPIAPALTSLRIYDAARPAKTVEARFFGAEQGYLSRASIGLEAIDLIQSLEGAARLHFAMDERGGGLVSAHVNVGALWKAIAPIKRRCRWRGERP